MGVKQIFETSDQVKLHVELQGNSDGPLIIWSHGFTGSARNWRSTVRQFSGYQNLIYDLRGHSRSEAPMDGNAYTLDRFALDVQELAHHFGQGRDVYLVGLSFGAMVSFQAVTLSQSTLKGVVLSSLPDPLAKESLTGKASAFAAAIESSGLEAAGAEYVWGPSSGMSERDSLLVKQGFMEHSAHGIAFILQHSFAAFPASEQMAFCLKKASVSTLMLYGEKDAAAINYSSRVLAQLDGVDQIQGKQIPAGGHLLNLTSNQVFSDVVHHHLSL